MRLLDRLWCWRHGVCFEHLERKVGWMDCCASTTGYKKTGKLGPDTPVHLQKRCPTCCERKRNKPKKQVADLTDHITDLKKKYGHEW